MVPGCKNDMSVSSSMSVLAKAGYLERYDIPGSLKRGTRLLKPNVTGAGLEIDREALDQKERIDRERLRLMLDFAYAKECRQQFILRALGEHSAERCGVCDRCATRTRKGERPPSAAEAVLMQKLLSCVARMSWRREDGWEGRFGKQRILQVLLGSKSKAVVEAGLDRLSTHGILREPGEPYVSELLREALESGFLQTGGGQYPVISLTPSGEEIMRGNKDYQICWPGDLENSGRSRQELSPKTPAKTPKMTPATHSVELAPADRELFDILREERSTHAQALQVPAFVVASDALLRELAAKRPLTDEAALMVKGVGQKKLDAHLRPLLTAIKQFALRS